MTARTSAVEAAGARPAATASSPQTRTVRVFHWSLVGLFVIAFVTGDEIEWLHIRVGYAIAALVALRIVWGLIGTRHARFSDFVRSPGEIATYSGQALRCRAPRHLGHNPVGGAMVVALLVMIAGIAPAASTACLLAVMASLLGNDLAGGGIDE